jgi:hypothetical protein
MQGGKVYDNNCINNPRKIQIALHGIVLFKTEKFSSVIKMNQS